MSGQFTLADAQNLINDLEKGERFYRLYKDAAVIASRVANLLQAEKDATDRAEKARKDESDILALIEKRLTDADADFEARRKDIHAAAAEAVSIRAQAVEDAKRAKDAAAKQVEDLKTSHQAALDNLVDEIGKKKGDLLVIQSAVNSASAELNKLNASIDSTREQLKKLLG